MQKRKIIIKIILSLTLFFAITLHFKQPNTNQDWEDGGKEVAQVYIGKATATIARIKNFSYKETDKEYNIDFYDKDFPLTGVKNVYYMVNPFWGYNFAHTYLTFEFENGEYISVSVEARKNKTQSYNPLYGAFKTYNLLYLFADEKDITTLRTIVRDDKLYSYKLKLSEQEKNDLWQVVLERGEKTAKQPEFYNTLFSSCTTNVFVQMNKVLDEEKKISFDWKILVPEDSAKIFYDKKMLDIDYEEYPTYTELKEASNIQDVARANRNLDSNTFSKTIHQSN